MSKSVSQWHNGWMHCSLHTLTVSKPHSSLCAAFHALSCIRGMKPVRFDTSRLAGVIYLFIPFARLLVLRVFARPGACSSCSYSSRSCRLSDEHSALRCSIIPSTANHHKALSSCWLAAIPPCWAFSSPPFFFPLLSYCIPLVLFM